MMSQTDLLLREATEHDAELILRWRNERAARVNSFQVARITDDEHKLWFSSKLAARLDTRIWILERDGVPVGQIRYDRREGGLELSFSIDGAVRGQGLGSAILKMSAATACRELNVQQVRGLTKFNNKPSIRAFERAGFTKDGESIVNGERVIQYVWNCP